jgi:hypothetical protein
MNFFLKKRRRRTFGNSVEDQQLTKLKTKQNKKTNKANLEILDSRMYCVNGNL